MADGTWQQLPVLPNGIAVAGTIFAPAVDVGATLIACLGRGNRVFRSTDFGQTWDSGVPLAGQCKAVVVGRLPNEFVPSTSIILHATADGNSTEATLVDHNSGQTQDLGFSDAIQKEFSASGGGAGSGRVGIWAVPRSPPSPGAPPGPASSYDLFAADSKHFMLYQGNGQWSTFQDGGGFLHVDTWSMAFPHTYDRGTGVCPVYTADDSGITANASGSCSFDAWGTASSGLHVIFGSTLAGISISNPTATDLNCIQQNSGQPCPTLFLPSADTDTFMIMANSQSTGSPFNSASPFYQWQNLVDGLGDSGPVLVDPSLPGFILAARNSNYNLFIPQAGTPLSSTASYYNIVPANAWGGIVNPAMEGLKQILTMPNDGAFGSGDYLAIVSPSRISTNCSHPNEPDHIVRNLVSSTSASNAQNTWTGKYFPAGQFPDGEFAACQIGGIYPSGGHTNTTVYVLTANDLSGCSGAAAAQVCPGQVWKTQIHLNGPSPQPWQLAMGSGNKALNRAADIFVNPYDPNELYAVDIGDSSIKRSLDTGSTWQIIPELKDISTNYGEFDFACGDGTLAPGSANYPDRGIFAGHCPATQMVFVPNHPEIRVAVLYPGGIAFSRDSGTTWISLNVTNATQQLQPIELPESAFYDPQLNAQGRSNLYVALQGKGLKRIEGPFASFPALFTLSGQNLTIAPGQTNVDILGNAATTGWPDPSSISVAISGLPAGVTARWIQTSPFIPPEQSVAGAINFSASLSAQDQQTLVSVTASSGGLSYTTHLVLTIAGVCHPQTACEPGQCGPVDNGCSGILACGGCSTGTVCSRNFCVSPRPSCPPGTHDCGNGVCTKSVCQ